jgi:hypothetical protein
VSSIRTLSVRCLRFMISSSEKSNLITSFESEIRPSRIALNQI